MQWAQVTPPVPQFPLLVTDMHVLPEQQPFGHDVASQLHAPPTQ
jgi:hypothetical protein